MKRAGTTAVRADLVVVGGGLAGLAAAALVARAGRSVVVVEQSKVLGGRAITWLREGIHFNLGPHALYRRGQAFRLLRELGVPFSGGFPDPGRGLLCSGDELYRLPRGIGTLLGSRLLSRREKAWFVAFVANLRKLDARRWEGIPVGAWIEQMAGSGNAAAFLRALVRVSTYVEDTERFSAGAAIDQLRSALVGNVWYLDGGWQTLVDGLRARAAEHGVVVKTSTPIRAVQSGGDGVFVHQSNGEIVRCRAAILAVAPRTACELLELPAGAPLCEWTSGNIPVKAACLDVACNGLPRPERRFALGLDRPLYFSVHSAAARLAPKGVAVLHVMKYLSAVATTAVDAIERELEAFLERLQPGWRSCAVAQRFLPVLTVAQSLPRADCQGRSGRPSVEVRDHPNVFLAGDWVGPDGLLADASAASARAAAVRVLDFLARTHTQAKGSLAHVAR
jgi:phytoene dehydrogenase-like protein